MWLEVRLILAGILALPALLLTVCMAPILALVSIPACCLLVTTARTHAPPSQPTAAATNAKQHQRQRHVIITGGSSGIGLAIALEAAVTAGTTRIVLIARTLSKLNQAREQVLQAAASMTNATKDITVEIVSLDVSDPEAVQTAVRDICATTATGTTDGSNNATVTTHVFVCAAGEPHVSKLSNLTLADYATVVQTNQLGSLYIAHAFGTFMTTSGTITLTSSMAGQVGVFGFTAYSPTKFALRGFAEAWHMELISTNNTNQTNIVIQVAYPPDTDTPGYALENIGKPLETKLISAAAGLASPMVIGRTMFHAATCSNPRLHVYFDLDGFLLCTLTSGFGAVSTLMDAVAQVSILNLTRWIALFYLNDWHRLIANHNRHQQQQQASTIPPTPTEPRPVDRTTGAVCKID